MQQDKLYQSIKENVKKIIFRNNYLKINKEFLKRKESTILIEFIIIAQTYSDNSIIKENDKMWEIQHYNKLQ